MSALKDTSLRLFRFTSSGTYIEGWKPSALNDKYGRLRAATFGPDGSLYVTTSNGGDDKILKITAS